MIINKNGINLNKWLKHLEKGSSADPNLFLKKIKDLNLEIAFLLIILLLILFLNSTKII